MGGVRVVRLLKLLRNFKELWGEEGGLGALGGRGGGIGGLRGAEVVGREEIAKKMVKKCGGSEFFLVGACRCQKKLLPLQH